MIRILTGDCRDVLKTLPDESVHACITSPPYWGLRDYGTGKWEGGDSNCQHKLRPSGALTKSSTLDGGKQSTGHQQEGYKTKCARCGAIRIDNQIGLETLINDYVSEMVSVFRDVRRVLRSDGTLWLNLGDSYAGGGRGGGSQGCKQQTNVGSLVAASALSGLKPKDLCGIPWRVAFALQNDGWWLRQDIIWSKPNPMPESITDRCTKAHEYLFLLSKNPRYFYDAEAIKEPSIHAGEIKDYTGDQKNNSVDPKLQATRPKGRSITDMRNKRSVWEIPSHPFHEAHFATFPPGLIEPCIKAGCPTGGTVLDLFGGAGTTGLVADRLKRNAILIELNPEYAKMAQRRIKQDAGIFADVIL